MSRMIQPSPLLRGVLKADLVLSAATALSMTLGAGPLSSATGLPEGLLLAVGVALLPWLALLLWLQRRAQLPSMGVWAVIVLNALWAVDCVLVAAVAMPGAGWHLTAAGLGFAITQAVGTVLLAEFQFLGLKHSRPVAA
ncbi:MAG: hypothetical protein ABIR94_08410 [Rubrivivax sp.]